MRFSIQPPMFKNLQCIPHSFKISQCRHFVSQTVIDRRNARDHFCFFFFPKYPSNSDSADTPSDFGEIWPESGQNLASFFSSFFFFFYEQIWGPIRELHEAGVGGGRFTGVAWVRSGRFTTLTSSLSLSLLLAQSPSHFHSRSLSLPLTLSLSLSLAYSLPLTLSLSLAHSLHLRRKLPPRPAPDAQIRSRKKKKKKKSLQEFAGFRRISLESGRVSPESLLIRVIQWDGGILGSKKTIVVNDGLTNRVLTLRDFETLRWYIVNF
jgi:hypothetical protein